jgi:hypothetical protein
VVSPGVAARLGIGWETVKALNPRAVMCSISALGQQGPLAELPGFDGQPRDLAGSRIKESSDGFTVSVAKKGGGGITVASKSGATLAQSIGGKQACFPGICTSQCCCDTSPAGRNTCCRFAQGKAAVCE